MDGFSAPKSKGAIDPWGLPLEGLDPSRAELFQDGSHLEFFKRLRQESPVHYTPQSQFGAFWSITRFHDIMAVDTNHQVFSSDRDIVIGDNPEGFAPLNFIAMDPPKHDVQRRAATCGGFASAVAGPGGADPSAGLHDLGQFAGR